MICPLHNWWDTTVACPVCGVPSPLPQRAQPVSTAGEGNAPVTAAVSEPAADAPIGCLEALDIPYFLRRNRDGSLKYPELSECTAALSVVVPRTQPTAGIPTVLTDVTDAQLYEWAESFHVTCNQRQPILRELWRREDRVKARLRIEKMKAAKAAKDAEPCGTKERLRPASLC